MLKLVTLQSIGASKTLVNKPSIIVRTLKNELKIKWQRPEKHSAFGAIRSGDLGKYVEPDQSNFCVQFQYATELEE